MAPLNWGSFRSFLVKGLFTKDCAGPHGSVVPVRKGDREGSRCQHPGRGQGERAMRQGLWLPSESSGQPGGPGREEHGKQNPDLTPSSFRSSVSAPGWLSPAGSPWARQCVKSYILSASWAKVRPDNGRQETRGAAGESTPLAVLSISTLDTP